MKVVRQDVTMIPPLLRDCAIARPHGAPSAPMAFLCDSHCVYGVLNTTMALLPSLHYAPMATMLFMCGLLYKLAFQSSYISVFVVFIAVCVHHYDRRHPELVNTTTNCATAAAGRQ